MLDSGPLGDYVNRREPVHSRVTEALRRGDRAGVCTPILGELLGGILGSSNPRRNQQNLFKYLRSLRLWAFDRAAAEKYAEIAAYLKSVGRPMQQIDIQTAAVAFVLGKTTVVTKDTDFQAIPGLDVEDWSIAVP